MGATPRAPRAPASRDDEAATHAVEPSPPSRVTYQVRLAELDFDLAQAARRVIEGSLGVVAGDHVVIVVDTPRQPIAAALSNAAEAVGGTVETIPIEQLGGRPLRGLPLALRPRLELAQASVLLVSFEEGEWTMRTELIALVRDLRLRHAHMVGLGRKTMLHGFSVDPQRVVDATRAVRTRIRPDSTFRARSLAGTDLEVRLDPRNRWQERVGIIRPGRFENLPSGELFTCPASAEGIFVADASLGGAVGSAAGLLARNPVRIEVRGGVARSVTCADRPLAGAVEAVLRSERNADRIGMVILGTNVGIRDATGEILCDQNLPGLHIGFGATFPAQTGASWDAPSQLCMTGTGADVDLDGAPILRSGRYLIL